MVLKAIERNSKFGYVVILSMVLHCVLIAVLPWSSIHQPQEAVVSSSGSSINAVMVNPVTVVQQDNRQKQRIDAHQTMPPLDKQVQQQALDLQRLKVMEKQRLLEKKGEKVQEQRQVKRKKQTEEVAKRAEAVAQVAKQSSEVDMLLGGLTDAKNAPSTSGEVVGTGEVVQQSGLSKGEVDAYTVQVRQAISNKFYDASSYRGRTCDLHIQLSPDGFLISIDAVGGDPALCQAAVIAAKLATMPQPPSPHVYEVFKNSTLGFSPQ